MSRNADELECPAMPASELRTATLRMSVLALGGLTWIGLEVCRHGSRPWPEWNAPLDKNLSKNVYR